MFSKHNYKFCFALFIGLAAILYFSKDQYTEKAAEIFTAFVYFGWIHFVYQFSKSVSTNTDSPSFFLYLKATIISIVCSVVFSLESIQSNFNEHYNTQSAVFFGTGFFITFIPAICGIFEVRKDNRFDKIIKQSKTKNKKNQ